MPSRSTGVRVLISDGDTRTALAAARSLVAVGHSVWVAARRRRSLASVTRGAAGLAIRENPLREPELFAGAIGRAASDISADVVLPITDASVDAVLRHRDLLPAGAALPFPTFQSFRAATDKVLMLDLAEQAGLGVPRSVIIWSMDQFEAHASEIQFPAVIKPHRSVVHDRAHGARSVSVAFADDLSECRRALRSLPSAAFPVLVQQRILGPGEGVFVLRWHGTPVLSFAHRRLRETPPAGGVSVYRESIVPDPPLLAAAHRMLEALDWEGVAMVECKRDRITGRHIFMEINGRLWGSLQLAVDAGADFPAVLIDCAMGKQIPTNTTYRAGVVSRWFWGDIDHLYLRLSRNAQRLHLAPDAPGRLGTLRDFIRVRRRESRSEIWRRDDPGPFVLETLRRLKLMR